MTDYAFSDRPQTRDHIFDKLTTEIMLVTREYSTYAMFWGTNLNASRILGVPITEDHTLGNYYNIYHCAELDLEEEE